MVKHWVRRNFQSFRQCVYEQAGALYKEEAKAIKLVPQSFSFFKHEQQLRGKKYRDIGNIEEWSYDPMPGGISKERAKELFANDAMCSHAMPDAASFE
eukprot:g15546.t1